MQKRTETNTWLYIVMGLVALGFIVYASKKDENIFDRQEVAEFGTAENQQNTITELGADSGIGINAEPYIGRVVRTTAKVIDIIDDRMFLIDADGETGDTTFRVVHSESASNPEPGDEVFVQGTVELYKLPNTQTVPVIMADEVRDVAH